MYLLLIKHSLTEPYVAVGRFKDSFEANKYFNETYKGFSHKIMSESDAIAMAKRKEERKVRRKQMISSVGKAVAGSTRQLSEEVKRELKDYDDRELARLRRAIKRDKLAIERTKLEQQRQKLRPSQPQPQYGYGPRAGFTFNPPSILLHPPFPTPMAQPAPAPPVKRKKYKKKSKKKSKKKKSKRS